MGEHHPDNDGPKWLTTRRKFLLAGALAGAGSMSVADALDDDGAIGNLWAGVAALNQAYNVAGELYVGPESARTSIDANSGRMYMATDTQVDFYGDGGSWVEMGVGSASNPVPSVHTDSVTADDLNTKSRNASYVVYTDGTNITAVPQDNPSDGVTLSKITGTDVGIVLEKLIEHQLPPQNDITEAAGRVNLKRGKYPGDLSNGDHTGVPLPTACHVIGETVTHNFDNPTTAVPAEEPAVWMDFSTRGFFAPNSTSDFLTGARLANVQLIGPGEADNGSIGLDDNNSNPWDWVYFDHIFVRKCDVPLNSQSDAMVNFYGCQFFNFFGQAIAHNRKYFLHSTFAPGADGTVSLKEARFRDGGLHGAGESAPFVTLTSGAVVSGARIEKVGGTDGNGTSVKLDGTSGRCGIYESVVDPEGDFSEVVDMQQGDCEAHITADNSGSTNTYKLSSGVGEAIIYGPDHNGVNNPTNGRLLRNGVWGLNNGDPNSTGDWNGNGKRGVIVEDYTNNTFYAYNAGVGKWIPLGRFPKLGSDPSSTDLEDGHTMIYVSDGSADITGDDGDVILAVNKGGTVKTTTLADFSAL